MSRDAMMSATCQCFCGNVPLQYNESALIYNHNHGSYPGNAATELNTLSVTLLAPSACALSAGAVPQREPWPVHRPGAGGQDYKVKILTPPQAAGARGSM